jgi:hypothetical protein
MGYDGNVPILASKTNDCLLVSPLGDHGIIIWAPFRWRTNVARNEARMALHRIHGRCVKLALEGFALRRVYFHAKNANDHFEINLLIPAANSQGEAR